MAKVRALAVGGNGTNCERETAFACLAAGAAVADIVSIWDLVAGEVSLRDYRFLCLPGGFLDGDDLGAAKACANRYRHARIADSENRLWDDIRHFVEAQKLVLGICNGFQLMVKLGLLPGFEAGVFEQQITLTHNASGRFENRWVDLLIDADSPCVFTRGIERLPLPIRHGEGRLVARDAELLKKLEDRRLTPLRYVEPISGEPTESYPANPNGSPHGIAGVCDSSGRLFGLMPHPEAYLHRTNHPRWTRQPELPEEGQGLKIFRNAIEYLS